LGRWKNINPPPAVSWEGLDEHKNSRFGGHDKGVKNAVGCKSGQVKRKQCKGEKTSNKNGEKKWEKHAGTRGLPSSRRLSSGGKRMGLRNKALTGEKSLPAKNYLGPPAHGHVKKMVANGH